MLELITIIIAITALLLPSVRNWYNEWKRLKDTKIYVLFIAKETLPSLMKKIDNLELLIGSIKKIDSSNFPLVQYITYNLENIEKINHKDLYKIFVQSNWFKSTKVKMRKFRNFNNSIGYLLQYNSIEDRNMTKFLDDRRMYEKNFKINLDKILRHYDNYRSKVIQLNRKKEQEPFLVEFINIVKNWNENDGRNKYGIIKKLLIDPIIKLGNDFPAEDRAMEILPLAINCDYELTDIIILHRKHYNSLSNALNTIKARVEDIELFLRFHS